MYKTGSEVQRVRLSDLYPTQMTVGRRAADAKLARRQADGSASSTDHRSPDKPATLPFFPAVRGPGERLYILDGHHRALALLHDRVDDVAIGLVVDLSALPVDEFWAYLDLRGWVHCYDQHGRRQDFASMPATFEELADDPYRSLATDLLAAGCFAKPDEPFYEYLWANFLRIRIPEDRVAADYDAALVTATRLARADEARYLPGWTGNG